jgi:hypothetical protein
MTNRLRRKRLTQGFTLGLQLDAVTVMNDPIQDRIGKGGLTDDFMMPPFLIA